MGAPPCIAPARPGPPCPLCTECPGRRRGERALGTYRGKRGWSVRGEERGFAAWPAGGAWSTAEGGRDTRAKKVIVIKHSHTTGKQAVTRQGERHRPCDQAGQWSKDLAWSVTAAAGRWGPHLLSPTQSSPGAPSSESHPGVTHGGSVLRLPLGDHCPVLSGPGPLLRPQSLGGDRTVGKMGVKVGRHGYSGDDRPTMKSSRKFPQGPARCTSTLEPPEPTSTMSGE